MKVRFTNSFLLFVVLSAGCGEILGEDFQGYRLKCTNGFETACGGGAGISGSPNEIAGAPSGDVAGGASGHAGNPGASCDANTCVDPLLASAGEGGSAGELAEPGIAGSNMAGTAGRGGSAGTAERGGSAGLAGTGGTGGTGGHPPGVCQPDAGVVDHCGVWEYITAPSIQGIAILSAEQFKGGFELFMAARGSSLLAQQWNRSISEEKDDWTSWFCFGSLPQPDRMAAHAMIDGIQEVFVTTLCGGLYRQSQEQSTADGALWLPVSLPSVGQAVTDVAISETADDTNVVYIADKGRVFARPRLGTEASSPYAAWQEVPGVSNASLVSGGMRSDQRQQVFIVDTDGTARTAIQSTSALDAPFGDWSDFDSSDLPLPLQDIEAPLGGPLPLEVYAIDANGALWQRTQDKTTGVFGPWTQWAGPALPGPIISVSGAGLKYAPNTPTRLMVLSKARHAYSLKRTGGVWEQNSWRLFP